MSRTKKRKKAPGHEYWGKRPMSNHGGAVPGRSTKKITSSKERMAKAQEIARIKKREGDQDE